MSLDSSVIITIDILMYFSVMIDKVTFVFERQDRYVYIRPPDKGA